MKIRKNSERDQHSHKNLTSIHSFSYASQIDPNWMSFYSLKVLSENKIPRSSQLNYSLSYPYFYLISQSGELETLCKNQGKTTIKAGDSLQFEQSQIESVALKSLFDEEANFIIAESLVPLDIKIKHYSIDSGLSLEAKKSFWWCQVLNGNFEVLQDGTAVNLEKGDGVGLTLGEKTSLTCVSPGEIIYFQVPNA